MQAKQCKIMVRFVFKIFCVKYIRDYFSIIIWVNLRLEQRPSESVHPIPRFLRATNVIGDRCKEERSHVESRVERRRRVEWGHWTLSFYSLPPLLCMRKKGGRGCHYMSWRIGFNKHLNSIHQPHTASTFFAGIK